MSLKFIGYFFVTTMKNEAKFEEELTCQFKIGIRNLTNFDPSTRKSQKFGIYTFLYINKKFKQSPRKSLIY